MKLLQEIQQFCNQLGMSIVDCERLERWLAVTILYKQFYKCYWSLVYLVMKQVMIRTSDDTSDKVTNTANVDEISVYIIHQFAIVLQY